MSPTTSGEGHQSCQSLSLVSVGRSGVSSLVIKCNGGAVGLHQTEPGFLMRRRNHLASVRVHPAKPLLSSRLRAVHEA